MSSILNQDFLVLFLCPFTSQRVPSIFRPHVKVNARRDSDKTLFCFTNIQEQPVHIVCRAVYCARLVLTLDGKVSHVVEDLKSFKRS